MATERLMMRMQKLWDNDCEWFKEAYFNKITSYIMASPIFIGIPLYLIFSAFSTFDGYSFVYLLLFLLFSLPWIALPLWLSIDFWKHWGLKWLAIYWSISEICFIILWSIIFFQFSVLV